MYEEIKKMADKLINSFPENYIFNATCLMAGFLPNAIFKVQHTSSGYKYYNVYLQHSDYSEPYWSEYSAVSFYINFESRRNDDGMVYYDEDSFVIRGK